MLGIKEINVRFFIYEFIDGGLELVEVSETEFTEAEGEIEYKRNTIFKNGCRQICLTKTNGYY